MGHKILLLVPQPSWVKSSVFALFVCNLRAHLHLSTKLRTLTVWVRKTHLYAKILIWKYNLIWHDPDLGSVKSEVSSPHGAMWPSHQYLRAKWLRKTVSHGMLLILIFSDLDLFKYDFRTRTLPFLDIYQHFWWVWALCGTSNQPESTKCENVAFWPLTWPDT